MITREQAVEIAVRHAAAEGRAYYSEGFIPHDWVVNAIMEAANGPRRDRSSLMFVTETVHGTDPGSEINPLRKIAVPITALVFPHDTQENTVCSDHPCAPHGYMRHASINEDRYVCECESWEPPDGCSGALFHEHRCAHCPDR